MGSVFLPDLAPLPLVLWQTPPGLDQILAQEGVPFQGVRDLNPLGFRVGRFVLYDGRRTQLSQLQAALTSRHVPIDIDMLREDDGPDPFAELLETKAQRMAWQIGDLTLSERVCRVDKARLRRELIGKLRRAIEHEGGLWARIAPWPFPYRSGFNLRVDLDEPCPEDYFRFARARRPLDDCTTHFVSTHAYGWVPQVLDDLKSFDTQSHGHFHVVYREQAANFRNLERAHRLLTQTGLAIEGFAAPEGRWNRGLDSAAARLGYRYASDFQVGYDDWPFFPWRGDRFSQVLQVPVHPVCEGVFTDQGMTDSSLIGGYLVEVLRRKIRSGEPAFLYGHPERRLGRYPEILTAIATEVRQHRLVWRVTLTEFARWWRWRLGRRWSMIARGDGRLEVQFDEWDDRYPIGLEIVRGQHSAVVPVSGPRLLLRLEDLAYERREMRFDAPEPTPVGRPRSLRALVRTALDWETVTPLDELPDRTLPAKLKKELRKWKQAHDR